jgi:hypothetical protein
MGVASGEWHKALVPQQPASRGKIKWAPLIDKRSCKSPVVCQLAGPRDATLGSPASSLLS